MEEELKKYLDNIISSTVIYSRSGGSTGSIISMKLRNKDNSLYTLWIECDWRIEDIKKVIATSADNIEPITGLVAKSAKMLEGKIIESIKLSSFYDLCISFKGGFCLNVFCIFSYDYEFETNWYLAIPELDLSFEITNHFKIKKGTYR